MPIDVLGDSWLGFQRVPLNTALIGCSVKELPKMVYFINLLEVTNDVNYFATFILHLVML